MRRILIAIGLALAILGGLWALLHRPRRPPELASGLWAAYRTRFVTGSGRVIDRGTDPRGITHTEGQGYGMLLAQAAGDRRTFDRIWRWTRGHLQRPDKLFYWRYGTCPTKPGDCVTGRNDAADGDILIAWALLRAGRAWHRPQDIAAARAIAAAIAAKLVIHRDGLSLLLPGERGFRHGPRITVNLSYWIFPAFRAFATAFHAPVWTALSNSGIALLRRARYGDWNLPPDWLSIDGNTLRPAPGFPPRYGFNAVRIPLYLIWGGRATAALLAPFRSFWRATAPRPPAWVNLATGAVAPFPWQTGMAAIAALAGPRPETAPLPPPGPKDGYYSSSLALLCRLAATESHP